MKKCFIFFVFIAFFISTSYSKPSEGEISSNQNPEQKIFDIDTYLDANMLLMFVFNDGMFAYDGEGIFNKSDGLYFPYTSVEDIENGINTKTVMFASGLWLAGVDDSNGDTVVTVAEYSAEYVPGPITGGSYGYALDPSYKVYKLYADSLESNPNQDYIHWPSDQGAPVDGTGKPVMKGNQMLWTVFNDADPSAHTNNSGSTNPLGVEVQQTVWSYSTGDMMRRSAIYMEYKLYNKGGKNLRNCYISVWADPDLGGASDDLVGCDTAMDVGYCYNGNNYDSDYGSQPPAVGFQIIRGPLVPSSFPYDYGYFENNQIPNHKNLPMTSFTKYINGTDPVNKIESYNYMQGLNANGNPYVNPFGQVTKYFHAGNPVNGVGDIDSNPSDRRLMLNMGPFDFAFGDSQYVKIKIGVGQGNNRIESITKLKEVLQYPESDDPVYSLKTIVEPNVINYVDANSLEGTTLTFMIGYPPYSIYRPYYNLVGSYINGINAYDTVRWRYQHHAFEGGVFQVYMPAKRFLASYPPVWDTVQTSYYVDVVGKPRFYGNVTLVGRLSGDINRDFKVDMSDLILLVSFMFEGQTRLPDTEAADVNHDGEMTISDVTSLVARLFK